MTAPPTVFVVDDDPAMRDSLQFLISSVGLAVESFESAEAFLTAYDKNRPGCLVLDVRMPGLSGLELQEHLQQDPMAPPVLLITGHGDIPMAVRALKMGAFDFIEKPFSDQQLLERIQQALKVDASDRQRELELSVLKTRVQRLTQRERQVFSIVVTGKPNKVIASELGLSQKTIEVHRSHVMEKMEAPTFAHLVRMSVSLEADGSMPQE